MTEQVAMSVQGPRITGRSCVWDLLSAPKRDHKSPFGHERFTAQARVVRMYAKAGHEIEGRWIEASPIVTLTLSPADVLAWQMAGAQLAA